MPAPIRPLVLAILALGCATGSGGAEDADAGSGLIQRDSALAPLGDASLFPFLDHGAVDAGASRDAAAAVD
ncbi:MAG: hypothetical protein JWM10_1518, partial [Myxococcaceae bacterium]|nr:hypothetical protein [Myxococcaceae bacterium]